MKFVELSKDVVCKAQIIPIAKASTSYTHWEKNLQVCSRAISLLDGQQRMKPKSEELKI